MPDDEELLDMLLGEEALRPANLNAWTPEDAGDQIDPDEYGRGAYGSTNGTLDQAETLEYRDVQEASIASTLATIKSKPELAVGGFGSSHPGGSQFAVGDGSVRFCAETIDPLVYLQLGNRGTTGD